MSARRFAATGPQQGTEAKPTMRAEYLIFNMAVLAVPAVVLACATQTHRHVPRMLGAVVLAAIPFVAWDVAVAGQHWTFNSRYVLGPRLLGLPLEEWLFFLTVPLACLTLWLLFSVRNSPSAVAAHPRDRWLPGVMVGAALVSAYAAWQAGAPYAAYVCCAFAAWWTADAVLGANLARRPLLWRFLGACALLTLVFNGYLTARPIVLYNDAVLLGMRIGTIPVEDFGFGAALIGLTVTLYERPNLMLRMKQRVAKAIAKRLQHYRVRLHEPTSDAPLRVARPVHAVVVGGGLAGLSAAAFLARRGVQVTVLEQNGYLGGKVGAWDEVVDGESRRIDHGFHAFFDHYYNLNRFLEELHVAERMCAIDDYIIFERNHTKWAFGAINTTPLLNILDLARTKLFKLRTTFNRRTGQHLEQFLRYDPVTTQAQWGHVTVEEFLVSGNIPPRLRLVFNVFARAFFTDNRHMSAAELIKSFHFYYLSHDKGLCYRYLKGNAHDDFLVLLRTHLESMGVRIHLNQGASSLALRESGITVDETPYDYAVIATDVGATRRLLLPCTHELPRLHKALEGLQTGQRYSVVRLWMAGVGHDVLPPMPVFVTTERIQALDAVAWVSRYDEEAAAWAKSHDGVVAELHCYAVDNMMPSEQVAPNMLEDLRHYFPCMAEARVIHQHTQMRDDFTSFVRGQAAHRPAVATEHPRLFLAGDWVQLPCPAMLMEAAHTSGLLAANAILAQEGARTFAVDSVPVRGLLARRR